MCQLIVIVHFASHQFKSGCCFYWFTHFVFFSVKAWRTKKLNQMTNSYQCIDLIRNTNGIFPLYFKGFLSCKVNSVQEACAKCFAVHILQFEILKIAWKKWNKEHQTLSFQFYINKSSILMLLFFMWFARIQILISVLQNIWGKFLVLSWL